MIRTSSLIHEALMQEFQDGARLGAKRAAGNVGAGVGGRGDPSHASPSVGNDGRRRRQSPQHQHHHDHPRMDDRGLVVPKKLANPCLDSKEVMELNREIKWNAKTGVNVLASKSELERAMDKRRWQRQMELKEREKMEEKTDFQRVLDQRAKKVEEISTVGKHSQASSSSGEQPEFLKIQLRHSTGAEGGALKT